MSTCTIIIKIKDYFPKIDSIPYQNFVCLLTNGDNEGQLPLISQENKSYQHQIKNVVSDIKYKVHVLDYNDMSLIGMCDITIPYNIISQITPPNGFIQEQQKKILMDVKTKRKLFGTVLNMGDIYLNIYSEIYLSEKKEPKKNTAKNSRSTARKKNILSPNSYGHKKKKLDGSPRTVKKKKIIIQINSDRQAIMNLNKNSKNFLNKSHIENNIIGNVNNTLFSTNITEQGFNGIDKNILEKGTEIRNDFNLQLNNDKNEKDNENMQLHIKNNCIKLIDFYSLLSSKLFKLHQKNITLNKKSNVYKEKLFTELKKNNILTQKKTSTELENFINVNINEGLNEKFLRAIIKVKKSEFKIYQNIFNLFYYEYDILKWKEQEKNKKMEENVKIELLLVVFKNLIKNYGNISQIYNDKLKKNMLKSCLNKYGISEKNENDESDNSNNNNNLISSNNNKDKSKNNVENKENKNDIDKFKVIKEVDEEKEDEIDDEEDKYSNNNRIHNNNYNTNQISYTSSNKKDSINMGLYSNEKLKSNNKNKSNLKSGQKLSFDNEDNKKSYDIIKSNLNNKLDDSKKNEENNNNVLQNSDNKKEEDINHEVDNKNEEVANNQVKEEKTIINNIEKEKEKEKILKEEEKIENKVEIKKEEKIENINESKNEEKEENINEYKKEEKEEKEDKQDIIEEEEKKVLSKKDENINESIKKNKDINEIITNNIDSVREEIKSLRNEKKIYEENKKEEAKIINNNNRIYTKNRVRNEKKKKEIYDKEDLIIQKFLIEEFPKKCKEENRFIRLSKYEYSFGDEKIRVELGEDDVILKLDEGDYKLDEFIDILNEGKEEQNEEEHEENENIEEVNEENNEDENENEDNISNSSRKERNEKSEKKGRRKRRKRVSEENSEEEEEKNDENENVNKVENVVEKKYNHRKNYNYEEDDYGKENYNNNNGMNEDNIDNDKYDNNNSGNKNMNYRIKKRKDYILQK